MAEEVLLVRSPVGGVGHGDERGWLALALGDGVDDPAQHLGHQRVGAVGRPAEQDRRGVTHPALELAGHPPGLRGPAPVGRLAGEDGLVLAEEHDRGDGCGTGAEVDRGRAAVAMDRRGGVGGAEVDTEDVRHGGSSSRLA